MYTNVLDQLYFIAVFNHSCSYALVSGNYGQDLL